MGRKPKLEVVRDDEHVDDGVAPANGETGAEPVLVNSDLTDEEKQALFLQGVAEIERNQTKKADAVGPLDAAIKLARKRMKAEGFTKSQVDDALRLRKMEPEEVEAEQRGFIEVARWCGMPIGGQLDLFDVAKDRTPLVERAYGEGQVAGMRGDDCKTPEKYSDASEAGQRWLDGWHAGQSVLMSAWAKRKPIDDTPEEGGGLPDAEGEANYEYT